MMKGGYTVIAGNHQLQAAKELGWQGIAVAVVDIPSDDAIAFALTDNKVSELGTTDNKALIDMLTSIDVDSPLMDALGWDDFSIAAIENTVMSADMAIKPNDGWTAPAIITNPSFDTPTQPHPQTQGQQINSNGNVTAETNVPTSTIVTQGSTSTGMSGTNNSSIQFTLVFEDSQQQSKWYSFIRWLKMSPVYEGETTAERLLDFIAAHSEEG